LSAVFFVITHFVGKEVGRQRFTDWETLKAMAIKGHEIGSHSCTHYGVTPSVSGNFNRFLQLARNEGIHKAMAQMMLTSSNRDDLYDVKHLTEEDEIGLSRIEIEDKTKKECKSYGYPGGSHTKTLACLAREHGYTMARTTYSGYNSLSQLNRYSLMAISWDSSTKAREANSWLDRAIRKNLWLIEVFHAIDLLDYAYSCSRGELTKHLDYVAERSHEIENVKIGEIA
jgi:peptidoglycan/xylan/chitin deacetylase (PgdA/CDA1 family)